MFDGDKFFGYDMVTEGKHGRVLNAESGDCLDKKMIEEILREDTHCYLVTLDYHW